MEKSAPHLMVLMMENRSYADIVGDSATAFETRLARTYETATSSYGVGHDSLDNYLAAISGRFYPWATADCAPGPNCHAKDPTLATQLNQAHVPWDAFMGSMPHSCDENNYDNGTTRHSYGVRHDPFVYFPELVKTDCARILPSLHLLGDLNASAAPDFVWYSPEICHDGGGDEPCATRAAADTFLSREIPAIQSTRWYRHGGAIVLTYDEGNGTGQTRGEYLHGAGNHVLTTVISKATYHKADDRSYVNQFGLLAGIERVYHLTCLGQACNPGNGLLPLPGAPARPRSGRRVPPRTRTGHR